jgi:hypothetical protein
VTKIFNLLAEKYVTEARALQLTSEEDIQVKRIIEEYKELKNTLQKEGIKNPTRVSPSKLSSLSKYKIGGKPLKFKRVILSGDIYYGIELSHINYKDRSKKEGRQGTNALTFVNFDKPYEDLSAVIYEVDKKAGITRPVIVINDYYVQEDYKTLYALISHELLHGVQKYKEKTSGYEQAIEDIRNGEEWDRIEYYTDPGELEVQIGEIAGNIKHHFDLEYQKYQKLNKTEGFPSKGWPAKRDQLIDELKKFFSSSPENYFEQKTAKLPSYLKRSEEFLETVASLYGASKETDELKERRQWETPWRRLQSVLFNLYQDLISKYLNPQ